MSSHLHINASSPIGPMNSSLSNTSERPPGVENPTRICLTRHVDRAELVLDAGPDKPPTLDWAVLSSMAEHLTDLERDPPRALIVRSEHPKYFCVGAHVQVLETLDENNIEPWVQAGHAVFNRLAELPYPTLAAVSGYALGGGLELALSCDVIFADRTARFGLPEARLGFVPGWGGGERLADRIGIAQTKHWFFTRHLADASEAMATGLIQRLADDDNLPDLCAAFLDAMSESSGVALASFKSLLSARASTDPAANAAYASALCLADPDTAGRIASFLSRKQKCR